MWIPSFLLEFWEPESQMGIEASDQDTQSREFQIFFFLENPTTRSRQVELFLPKEQDGVLTSGDGRVLKILFRPNENNKHLDHVGFKVQDTKPKSAFSSCFNVLSQLMSIWSLETGAGFSIFGCRILDPKHQANWKIVPQRVTPDLFFIPAAMALDDEYAAMLSLYREARNSQSLSYRFLCCYKILEAWYNHGSIFAKADRLIKEHNVSLKRPRRKITQDLLVSSLVFNNHPEFKELSFGDFFQRLSEWRKKVAHAITDSGDFINLDKYEWQLEIGPIANLTDLIARQVLLDEFELWRALASGGHVRV